MFPFFNLDTCSAMEERKALMKLRERQILLLKRKYKVTRQDQLPKDVEIPPVLPKIKFLPKQLISNMFDGLKLIIEQVDRMFDTYGPTVDLEIVIGKWTQDYVEGFFGIARGMKGQYDTLSIADLFSTLRFMQNKG